VSVAQSVKVAIEDGQKLPSGGYEVVHGTQVIGFGKDHRGAVVWMYPTRSAISGLTSRHWQALSTTMRNR